MNIEGKVAFVTGSSRGIGRAIAEALARHGADIVINYSNDKPGADSVADEILQIGRRAIIVQGDMSNPDDISRARETITRELGEVNILVNNAGGIIRPGDWDTQTDENIRRTIDINLLSTIFTIRAFAPRMAQNGFGRIVNITTTYSFNGAPPVLAYTAAKAGVNTVTMAMAGELADKGVLVNAVAPGNVDTGLTRSGGRDLLEWTLSTVPVGRLAEPREIAEAVIYLVSSDYICGHILCIDGGQLLKI